MTAPPDRSVFDQLYDSVRVQRTARMLPTDRPLTPDEIDAVARAYESFRADHDLPHSTVAAEMGRDPSELIKFAQAAKRGGYETVARQVNEWMERRARQTEARPPEGFIETEVARRMHGVIHGAITNRAMAVITGPAGVGKTMMLQATAAAVPGSVYIRVNRSIRRAPGLAKALCRRIGGGRRDAMDVVFDRLVQTLYGTGRPILIDEAHQLTHEALELIRDLHDEAGGLPIVLCGTRAIADAVDDRRSQFGQFGRRVFARIDISEQAIDRTGRRRREHPLFSAEEIRRVVSASKLKLDGPASRYLADLANVDGAGGLGLCMQLVRAMAHMDRQIARGERAITSAELHELLVALHPAAFLESITQQSPPKGEVRRLAQVG